MQLSHPGQRRRMLRSGGQYHPADGDRLHHQAGCDIRFGSARQRLQVQLAVTQKPVTFRRTARPVSLSRLERLELREPLEGPLRFARLSERKRVRLQPFDSARLRTHDLSSERTSANAI